MALYDDLFGVESRIAETPATTIAGMRIKARMIARDHDDCRGHDLAAVELAIADPEGTDKYTLSLVADLLRLTT